MPSLNFTVKVSAVYSYESTFELPNRFLYFVIVLIFLFNKLSSVFVIMFFLLKLSTIRLNALDFFT